MKTCPVCQAKAFDDAAICYGCMHRFNEEKAEALMPLMGEGEVEAPAFFAIGGEVAASGSPAREGKMADPESPILEGKMADPEAPVLQEDAESPALITGKVATEAPAPLVHAEKANTPPSFCIRLMPEPVESGGVKWSCAVEVA